MTPLFSIIHPSARPDQWRKVYDAWITNAVDPSRVEYILVCDERWGFNVGHTRYEDRGVLNVVIGNWEPYKHSGYVSSVNIGARKATGQILIVVADDQFPCEYWDDRLSAVIETHAARRLNLGHDPAKWEDGIFTGKLWAELAVSVSTNTPSEHDRNIMVMPILSRARYERLGYVFYPEYESMFADNEFAEHAKQDGVVIDARHLVFPHKHWLNRQREVDNADRAQNAEELYRMGHGILQRRRALKFAPVKPEAGKENADTRLKSEHTEPGGDSTRPPVLALCTPGETFSYEFVANLRRIDYYLQHTFVLQPIMGHVTEPWRARQDMLDTILTMEPRPDYILWIDDDNLPTVEQIKTLYEALASKNLDMIAGCCWIQFEGKNGAAEFRLSFGWFNEEKTASRMALYPDLTGEIVEADWTGFPVVLMKREVLERAGALAFRPISDDRFETGMMGEDISFCRHASERGGVKIHVHTGVRVPHLKTRAIEPEFVVKERAAIAARPCPSPGMIRTPLVEELPNGKTRFNSFTVTKKPRIIGAMRVKNEGRWIKRCIESLFPLCESVYVMDDGSDDDTSSEVLAACHGQTNPIRQVRSPFIGRKLDEARDKQHLLELIQEEKSPDYILWIDGDEELEPGGAEKILQTLAQRPDVKSWNLRFYYLWNDTKTIRWDRWYSTAKRPSLFKVEANLRFKSYYEGCGVHSGLHTSNAPYDYNQKAVDLDVFLIHYGYIFSEDRIKKYRYYNEIDPHNEMEDEYRHMVVDDIFPAWATFKWAGPLELKPLPFTIPPLECESRECDTHEDFEREYARLVGAM